jgi:hypothetical protein
MTCYARGYLSLFFVALFLFWLLYHCPFSVARALAEDVHGLHLFQHVKLLNAVNPLFDSPGLSRIRHLLVDLILFLVVPK